MGIIPTMTTQKIVGTRMLLRLKVNLFQIMTLFGMIMVVTRVKKVAISIVNILTLLT